MPAIYDFIWGTELRTNHPQLFYLRDKIAALIAGAPAPHQVTSGQLWYVLPRDASITLYRQDKSRQCGGRLSDDGYWDPIHPPPSSPEAIKLFLLDGPSLEIELAPRPGLVLAKPYSPLRPKARTMLDFGRAVVVFGTTKKKGEPGELPIRYSKHLALDQPEGYFQFWQSWGIKSKAPDAELISYYSSLADSTAGSGHRSREVPHQAATRLLSEFLGLREANPPWPRFHRFARPNRARRGEIVFVEWQQGVPKPALVVSPNGLQDHHRYDPIVVLQFLDYDPRHMTQDTVLPLGEDGAFPGVPGRWSIDLSMVRSISPAAPPVVT